MKQNDTKTEPAGARTHDWSGGGQFCSCGQDTVTCQGCGRLTCGDVAIWKDGKGNIGPCCFTKFNIGFNPTPQPTPPPQGERTQVPIVVERAMLVYQAGIANVFAVECHNLNKYGRDARRLLQSDFRTCESFARGLGAAGVIVHTAACNQAGDIINATWSEDLDSQPFSESFRPVELNTIGV